MNLKEIKEKLILEYGDDLIKDSFIIDSSNSGIKFVSHNTKKKISSFDEMFHDTLDYNKSNLYFYNPLFESLKNKEYKNCTLLDAFYREIRKSSKNYISPIDFQRMSQSRYTESLVKRIMASHNKPGIYHLLRANGNVKNNVVIGVCLVPFEINSHLGNYIKRNEKLKGEENLLSLITSSNDQEFLIDRLSKLKMSRNFNDLNYPLTISKLAPSFLRRMSIEDSNEVRNFLKIHNGDFVYNGEENPFIQKGEVLFCDGSSYVSENFVVSRNKHIDSFFVKA